MADQGEGAAVGGGGGGGVLRDYRKGNWTPKETAVLIEAKRIDDERRARKDPLQQHGGESRPAPASEFRWKWVEDYCWGRGCYRSKNQCNDRWDNLMRDYKKVRAHDRTAAEGGGGRSYWLLEKQERKERSLPSNFLPDVYEALVGMMERREEPGKGGASGDHLHPSPWEEEQGKSSSQLPSDDHLPPWEEEKGKSSSQLPSDDDQHGGGGSGDHLPLKKKKKRREEAAPGSGGDDDEDDRLSDAIRRSVSVLAEALAESEGREDARHSAVLRLRDRQMGAERARVEAAARAVAGLSDAISGLATSIRSLSPRIGTGSPPPPPNPK